MQIMPMTGWYKHFISHQAPILWQSNAVSHRWTPWRCIKNTCLCKIIWICVELPLHLGYLISDKLHMTIYMIYIFIHVNIFIYTYPIADPKSGITSCKAIPSNSICSIGLHQEIWFDICVFCLKLYTPKKMISMVPMLISPSQSISEFVWIYN